LGLVIGFLLVLGMGAAYDKTYQTHNRIYEDDYGIYFGSDSDVTLEFDGTNFELFAAAVDTPFVIGSTSYGFDITYYFEDAGTIAIDFDGDCITISDGMAINIGGTPATDGVLSWDNTNAEVDLTTATGSIHFTASAVPDAQYGFEVGSTIAGTTRSEGASGYFHTTVTGNLDGATYVTGTWMDIGTCTPTANVMAPGDFGIYESGGTLSSVGCMAALNLGLYLDATSGPPNLAMFRFNANSNPSTGTLPDYFFYAVNKAAVAYSYGTGTDGTKQGAIKVYIAGGDVGTNTMYIRLYDAAN